MTNELLEMFLFETGQMTKQLEGILLESEAKGSFSEENINEIFRIMHTVKGSAAMMSYSQVSSVAHSLEDLFYFIREEKPDINVSEICDLMLRGMDYIKSETGLLESDEDNPQYSKSLRMFPVQVRDSVTSIKEKSKSTHAEKLFGAVNISKTAEETTEHRKQSMISVNVGKLDRLIELVSKIKASEATVIKNPDLEGLRLENFTQAAKQFTMLTEELQKLILSVRSVSLEMVFAGMNRIVRDMSKRLKKDVVLKADGESTEVDKSILDHMADPLMHLIRNCMDHGIEEKEERIKNGKPPFGTIRLEARNDGEYTVFSVSDDGRGLDRKSILKKALAGGFCKSNECLNETELYNLILLPGFSTKERITEYSGRGVGLDVVRKNVELMKGSIRVESKQGQGTSFTIKIPHPQQIKF